MLVSYQSLDNSSEIPFLRAEIRKCEASPLGLTSSGKKRWRLCFLEPPLNDQQYRIAAVKNQCFSRYWNTTRATHASFTLVIEGKRQIVFLSKKSLMSRFSVSENVVEEAFRSNDLSKIVLIKIVQANLPNAPSIAQSLQSDLYFSAKDHKIPKPIYVTRGGLVFTGIKNSLVGKGGHARVKTATTLDGTVVARRISRADPWGELCGEVSRERLKSSLKIMKKFCGRPHIIPLLESLKYRKGCTTKLVTFHPYIPKSLYDLFEEKSKGHPIPKETQYAIADQLFVGLQALDGAAHADVKPENILVTPENKVFWIDLDMLWAKEEKGTIDRGTPNWAAPEMFFQTPVNPEKLDVWGLGIILAFLFSSFSGGFSWQFKNKIEENETAIKNLTQESVYRQIDQRRLPAKEIALLKKMIVIKSEDRCTLNQAADFFRKEILDESKTEN